MVLQVLNVCLFILSFLCFQIALFPLPSLQVHWIYVFVCLSPLVGHVFLAFHQHIRLYLDILIVILKRFWIFFSFYIAVKEWLVICVNKQFYQWRVQTVASQALSGPWLQSLFSSLNLSSSLLSAYLVHGLWSARIMLRYYAELGVGFSVFFLLWFLSQSLISPGSFPEHLQPEPREYVSCQSCIYHCCDWSQLGCKPNMQCKQELALCWFRLPALTPTPVYLCLFHLSEPSITWFYF